MLSVMFYGMIAYLIVRQGFSWKTQVRLDATAFILSLLIGFSLRFLGVHFLTDVLGGWAVGIFWLAVCVTVLDLAQLSSSRLHLKPLEFFLKFKQGENQ